MKNIVLFDTAAQLRALLPLTFTRPAALCRCGILTVAQKWERMLGAPAHLLTCGPLTLKYPYTAEGSDLLLISGAVLPSAELCATVAALPPGGAVVTEADELVAYRGTLEAFRELAAGALPEAAEVAEVQMLRGPQDIFRFNDEQLRSDFRLLTAGRTSAPLHPSCAVIGDPALIFVEPGATTLCSTFNTTEGPIYIGPGAEVMEGSAVRGPLALCEHAVLRMGTRAYGGTTIGPWSKVGGEIANVVVFGYSNKAHDGYLGNAVIGEWCNLGAGCVSSNLKNDYSKIRLWSYDTCRFERTDMQFCGLIMGDHSKAGIQTMFNTATVVGVGCNIHGAGFPRTFIPSFSFGGAHGMERVRLNKFMETASTVMARRHIPLSEADRALLTWLYESLDDYGHPTASLD